LFAVVLPSRSPWPVSASLKYVSLVKVNYDIHEDEQNGYVTERKNRKVCWRRCDSWKKMLKGSTHGTSFSRHSVVKETEHPV